MTSSTTAIHRIVVANPRPVVRVIRPLWASLSLHGVFLTFRVTNASEPSNSEQRTRRRSGRLLVRYSRRSGAVSSADWLSQGQLAVACPQDPAQSEPCQHRQHAPRGHDFTDQHYIRPFAGSFIGLLGALSAKSAAITSVTAGPILRSAAGQGGYVS